MTFDPSVPNAAQSPGLFPPQNSTNFARLKTIINADHVFNDTAQANDGAHRQVTMLTRSPPISLPTGTNAILYGFLDSLGRAQLVFYNGFTHAVITSVVVGAAVNFNGTGGTGVKTIRSAYNVASVTKTDVGKYTILFTVPLPDNNYIVQVTGQGGGINGISNGAVDGSGSYNSAMDPTGVKVVFNGSGSNLIDVTLGSVTIMRVT